MEVSPPLDHPLACAALSISSTNVKGLTRSLACNLGSAACCCINLPGAMHHPLAGLITLTQVHIRAPWACSGHISTVKAREYKLDHHMRRKQKQLLRGVLQHWRQRSWVRVRHRQLLSKAVQRISQLKMQQALLALLAAGDRHTGSDTPTPDAWSVLSSRASGSIACIMHAWRRHEQFTCLWKATHPPSCCCYALQHAGALGCAGRQQH